MTSVLRIDDALVTDTIAERAHERLVGDPAAAVRRRAHNRGWLLRRGLVAADTAGLVTAFVVAAVAAKGFRWLVRDEIDAELTGLLLLAMPCWIVLAKVYGLYDRDGRYAQFSTTQDIGPVASILTLSTLVYLLVWPAAGFGPPSHLRAAVFWLSAIMLVPLMRAGARAATRGHVDYVQNTVIVGAGDVGQSLARKFLNHPEAGINVIGFVDAEPKQRRDDLDHLPLLGAPDDLPQLARRLAVDRVVIAFSTDSHEDVLELVRGLREVNVIVDIVPRFFDLIGPGVEIHTIEGMPLVGLATLRLPRSSLLVKRAIDLLLSGAVLVLLAPVLLAIAVAVKLDSHGPVFFRQTRMGTGGHPFHVLKFRTMVADADRRKHEFAHLNRHLAGGDARMFKIENDPRVTRVGRVLRRYFLDELPQLVNVLRGDMSLIGPRPLILDEARYVDTWGRRRLDLKPGMTGPWQVLGRSTIAFEEMVKLDYFYVTTWSLAGDLRLLLQTIALVVRGEAPV